MSSCERGDTPHRSLDLDLVLIVVGFVGKIKEAPLMAKECLEVHC